MAKSKPAWSQQLSGGHWVTMNKVHLYIRDGDNTVVAGPASWVGADAGHLTAHHMRQPGATMKHLPAGEEPPTLPDDHIHNPTAFRLGRAAAIHAYTRYMADQEAKQEGAQSQPVAPQGGLFPGASGGSTSGSSAPARPASASTSTGGSSLMRRPTSEELGGKASSSGQETPDVPQPSAPPHEAQGMVLPPDAGAAPSGGGDAMENLRTGLAQAHDDFMDFASSLDRWYPGVSWDDLPEEDRAEFETLRGAYMTAKEAFTKGVPEGNYDARGQSQDDEDPGGGTTPPPAASPPPAAPAPEPSSIFENPNKSRPLSGAAPDVLPATPQPPQPQAEVQAAGAQQGTLPAPVGPSAVDLQHGEMTRHYLRKYYPRADRQILDAPTTRHQLEAIAHMAGGQPEFRAKAVERVGHLAAHDMVTDGYDESVRAHLLAHSADIAARLRAQAAHTPEEGVQGGSDAPVGPSGHPLNPAPAQAQIPAERLSTRGEDVGQEYLDDLGYRDPGDPNTPAASRLRQKRGYLGGLIKRQPEGEGSIDLGSYEGMKQRQAAVKQRLGTTPGLARVRQRKQTPEERAAWERKMEELNARNHERGERNSRAGWLMRQSEPVDEETQNHLDHLESPAGHAALTRALEGAIPRARMQGEMDYMRRLSGLSRRDRERERQLQSESGHTSKQERDLSLMQKLLGSYGRASDPQARSEAMQSLENRVREGLLRGLPLQEAPPTEVGLRQGHLNDARAFLAARGDPRAEPGREHIDPDRPQPAGPPPAIAASDDVGMLHSTGDGRAKLRGLVEGTFARNDIENDLHRRMLADLAGRLHKEAAGGELDEHDMGAVRNISGLVRHALERTRHGAAGAASYQPDHSLTGHLPYRTMVGERAGATGVGKLDDMVYNARKAHERGTHPLSPEQFEHLKKLSAALYRLKQVKQPGSPWARDALREVHGLLPGADAFLNPHNPEHEGHRRSLQRLAEHIHASDPTAPSLEHVRAMMEQHGGRLDLPESAVQGAGSGEENAQFAHFSSPAAPQGGTSGPDPELASGVASKAGLLDDVLGSMAADMGDEEPAQHQAGGTISIPVEDPESGGEARPRPETLAARKRGGPPSGSVTLPGFGSEEEPMQPEPPPAVFGQGPPRSTPPTASGAPLREPEEGEGGIQPHLAGPNQHTLDAERFLLGNMSGGGTQLGFGDQMDPEPVLTPEKTEPAKSVLDDKAPVEKETGPVQTGFLDLTEPTEEKETGPVQMGFLDLGTPPGGEPVEQEPVEQEPASAVAPRQPQPVVPQVQPAPSVAGPATRYPQWNEEAITRRATTQQWPPVPLSPLDRGTHTQQQEQAAGLMRSHAAENILRGGVGTLPEEEEEPEEGAVPRRGGGDQRHPREVMPFMYAPGATLPPRERHAANVMWHRAGTPAEQVAMLARYAHGFAPHLGRPPEPRDPMNVTPADQDAQRKWAVRSARYVRNTIDRMVAHLVPEQTGTGHPSTNQISSLQARRYRQLGDALLWHAQNEGRIPDPEEFARLYGASESGRLEDEEDPINHEHVERQLHDWLEQDADAVGHHAGELHQYALAGHDMADGRPEHPRVGPNTLFETAKRLGALAEHKGLWDSDQDVADALVQEYAGLPAASAKEHARALIKQARRGQFLDHPEHGSVNPGTLHAVGESLLAGGGTAPRHEEVPVASLAPAAPETSPAAAGAVNVGALERGAQAHSQALAGEGSSLEEASRLARNQAAMTQQSATEEYMAQSPYVNQVRHPGGYRGLYDQADYAYRHTSEPEKRLRLGLLKSHLHEIANDPTLSSEERQWQLEQAALYGHGLDDELSEAQAALHGRAPTGPTLSPEEHGRNVERRAGALRNELREVVDHLAEVGNGGLVRPAQDGATGQGGKGENWRLYSDADLHAAHLERDIAAMRRGKADHPVVGEAEEALASLYGNFLRHHMDQARTRAGTGHGEHYVSPRRVRYDLDEYQRKLGGLRADHPLLGEAQEVRDALDEKIGAPLGAEDLRKERRRGEEESPYEQAMRAFHADRTARGLTVPLPKQPQAIVNPAAAAMPEEEDEEQELSPPPAPPQAVRAPEERAEGKILPSPASEGKILPSPESEGKVLPPSEGVNQAHVAAILQRAQGQERGYLQSQIDAFHKVAGYEEDVVGQGSQQVTRQTAAEAARRLEEMRDQLEARDTPPEATPASSPAPTSSASPPTPSSPREGARTAHEALGPVQMGEQLNTPHGPLWVDRYHEPSGTVHGQVGDKLMSFNLHEHGPDEITRIKPDKPDEGSLTKKVGEAAYGSGWINPLVA